MTDHRGHCSIAFAANDDRSQYLFSALAELADIPARVNFDQVDPLTRYAAAALSFRRDRAEWWNTYQMHPLMQRRRRKVLQRALIPVRDGLDGLVMWGSWFHPRLDEIGSRAPFVTYVDQSLSLEPALGELPKRRVNRRAGHRLQAATYADARAILTFSEWARVQTLHAHPSVAPEKVRAVGWGPCAVDLSSEPLDPDRREPLVLHVSNDFFRKGLDFLVQTAAVVRQSIPRARFVVIGKDYGGMSGIPASDGVEFVGRVTDRAILADWFRRASVFFLPQRFDRSPHVLVEAMSAGLPIVTSAQGGALELTTGTGAGRSVPIGDVAGYARSIIELLDDPATAAAMGERGRQLMRRSYTWTVVARKVLDAVLDARVVSRETDAAAVTV